MTAAADPRQLGLPGVDVGPRLDRQGGAAARTLVEVVGTSGRPRVVPFSSGFGSRYVSCPRAIRRVGQLISVAELRPTERGYYRAIGPFLERGFVMRDTLWTECYAATLSEDLSVSVWTYPQGGWLYRFHSLRKQCKEQGKARTANAAKKAILGEYAKYVEWKHRFYLLDDWKYNVNIEIEGEKFIWELIYVSAYAYENGINDTAIASGEASTLNEAQIAGLAALASKKEQTSQVAAQGTLAGCEAA